MYDLFSLEDIKSWLSISGTSQDTFLSSLKTATSRMVEHFCNANFISRQVTEFYTPKKSTRLILRNSPVYLELDSNDDPSNVTLHQNSEREWTSDFLVQASDYVVKPDEGFIELYNDEYQFANLQSSVRAIYWYGFSRFNLIDEQNNYIDLKEDDGSEISIELTSSPQGLTFYPGYTAEALCSLLQTALNDDSNTTGTYTVTYNHNTQKFKIAASGITKLTLLSNTGSNVFKSIYSTIGYSVSADKDTDATTEYTADNSVTGLMGDLKLACQQIAYKSYQDSKEGDSIQNIKSKELSNKGGTTMYDKSWLPKQAYEILMMYKRIV